MLFVRTEQLGGNLRVRTGRRGGGGGEGGGFRNAVQRIKKKKKTKGAL